MKWLMAGLFVLVLGLALVSAYMDKELYVRITEIECYIGQQFAYADSLMKICDSDPGLAWTKVADDAHTARSIMGQWLSKQPWRDEMRQHARATNQNRRFCVFLHAKVESLAAIHAVRWQYEDEESLRQ
jgi:hypothetical protein